MKSHFEQEAQQTSSLSRRRVLGLLGATAAASLTGCTGNAQLPSGEDKTVQTKTANGSISRCVVRPQQTEGPYFIDEKLNRSDIRSDPSGGAASQGVPLNLVLQVSRIDGRSCTALAGAIVDIWQCDARGAYSDIEDFSGLFDTRGKKFLRGYQATDANGTARFKTIYPGWYPGRTVHIHYKIRTDPAAQKGFEFTSQLYFDDAITDQVHAQEPYASRGQRTLKNERDGIFRRGGNELLLSLTKDAEGYAGIFDLGLQIS